MTSNQLQTSRWGHSIPAHWACGVCQRPCLLTFSNEEATRSLPITRTKNYDINKSDAPLQTTTRLPESTPYNWLLKSSTPLARIEANTSLYPGATQGAASTWSLKKNCPQGFHRTANKIISVPPKSGVLLLTYNLTYLKIIKVAFKFCRPQHQMLVLALQLKITFLVPDG